MTPVKNKAGNLKNKKHTVKQIHGSILVYGNSKAVRDKHISELIEKAGEFCIDDPAKKTISALANLADVFLVSTLDSKKTIGIEQVKQAIRFLAEKPFSCAKKFLIINEAEKLTIQAQNALLKTLEEPPSYSVIILGAKTENFLLDTVVSRCKKINAGRIVLESKAYKTQPTEKASIINKNGSNSNNQQDQTDRAGEYAFKTTSLEIDDVLALSYGERVDWVSEFCKEERDFIIDTLEFWVTQERTSMNKSKESQVIETKARNISEILKIIKDLENTNVNTRLSLEVLVLNLL